jgi:transposase
MAAQNSGISKFVGCGNTMVRWSKGILNSFDCPYTNGFTEGANNKIKVLKRNAYGYRNFRRFRNRILHMFSHSAQKGAA